MSKIQYKRLPESELPYKYELTKSYTIQTKLRPKKMIGNKYVIIMPDGMLLIDKGYRWDGPSGPAIDTESFMRASLVHDALYQLIREGHLSRWRKFYADNLMLAITKEDGMFFPRYVWCWLGVAVGGWPSTF